MARFLYYVAPLTQDKWNILFEDQRRPFIYDSEEDALKAARKAAERTFEKQGRPSGVLVKEGTRWRDGGAYGEEAD
jgi:hypothetical protein